MVEVAAEGGVEALELGGVTAQHDAEQAGQQPQLRELARVGVLPPLEDLAGDPADLPVVGHLGEQRPVEVVGVAEVVAEPVGQRLAVEGTHPATSGASSASASGRRLLGRARRAAAWVRLGSGVAVVAPGRRPRWSAVVAVAGPAVGVVGAGLGTTDDDRGGVDAVSLGVGAVTNGDTDVADGETAVSTVRSGSGSRIPNPTAQAMPADPTTARRDEDHDGP